MSLRLASGDGRFVGVLPVTCNSLLCLKPVFEPTDVEVEDGKLVLGQDILVWLSLNATPNVADGFLEIVVDGRIEVAFGVASNVDRTLVAERTEFVNDAIVVATHAAVCWRSSMEAEG